MALKITSIVRENPAPCNHYRLTIDEDGRSKTIRLSRVDMANLFDDTEYGPKGTLILAWLRYKLSTGSKLNDIINVVIA